MISAEVLINAEQRRIAWRCRRGMLELDIILQRFIQTSFKSLTLSELAVLDGLLDLPDGEFWSIVQSEKVPKDPNVTKLVNLINAGGIPMKTEEG